MTRVLLVSVLIFIASCNSSSHSKNTSGDTTQSVVTIPMDSIEQPMPVVPMDTAESNMPVVNPDTGKVVPK